MARKKQLKPGVKVGKHFVVSFARPETDDQGGVFEAVADLPGGGQACVAETSAAVLREVVAQYERDQAARGGGVFAKPGPRIKVVNG